MRVLKREKLTVAYGAEVVRIIIKEKITHIKLGNRKNQNFVDAMGNVRKRM